MTNNLHTITLDSPEENLVDEKMIRDIGLYNTNEAVKLYNEAVETYQLIESKHLAQERAMIVLKRAMPYLQECKRIGYNDIRIQKIIDGMSHIMLLDPSNSIKPI